MKRKPKQCCFCRVSLERHVAIAWDGLGSACVTLKDKVTDDQRKEYVTKLKPMWAEWGRAFGGNPPDKNVAIASTNGHAKKG